MTSLEKLHQLLTGAANFAPTDEGMAKLIQTLQVAGPMIGPLIPDTAEELDETLEALIGFAARMRSDQSPPLQIDLDLRDSGTTTGEWFGSQDAAEAEVAQ